MPILFVRTLLFTGSLIGALVFSHLSVAQTLRATGALFVDPAVYRSIPHGIAPARGALPPKVDLTDSFPPPGDQGNQGSCVGWAAAYLKSYQERVERNWDIANTAHHFSPSFIYNQIRVGDCNAGAYAPHALGLLHERGAASLATFPYQATRCDQVPSMAQLQDAMQYQIAGFRTVNAQDTTEIKQFLASGYPILIVAAVDMAFRKWRGTAPFRGASEGGPHAMVIVGYDDSRQAVQVINSWGQAWGDRGYAWISYNGVRQMTREAYVAYDIVDPLPRVVDIVPPPEIKPNIDRPFLIETKSPALTYAGSSAMSERAYFSLSRFGATFAKRSKSHLEFLRLPQRAIVASIPLKKIVGGPIYDPNDWYFGVALSNDGRLVAVKFAKKIGKGVQHGLVIYSSTERSVVSRTSLDFENAITDGVNFSKDDRAVLIHTRSGEGRLIDVTSGNILLSAVDSTHRESCALEDGGFVTDGAIIHKREDGYSLERRPNLIVEACNAQAGAVVFLDFSPGPYPTDDQRRKTFFGRTTSKAKWKQLPPWPQESLWSNGVILQDNSLMAFLTEDSTIQLVSTDSLQVLSELRLPDSLYVCQRDWVRRHESILGTYANEILIGTCGVSRVRIDAPQSK